jgi:16S rRNA (uracil1498-N3)-methyltransferase
MRLHRFIKEIDLRPGVARINDTEFLNQLKNVFRLEIGDKIAIADGGGSEGIGEIRSFYKNGVELGISDVSKKIASHKTTTLYLAIIKKDNFELAAQKAIECGIGKIVPIITGRTVKMNLNMERLRKIAVEAAEQCGRADLPEISEPIKFDEAVKNASGINIFLDMNGEKTGLAENGGEISIWVGPEGGWEESERDRAKSKGFKIISLGDTTLRAETAAMIASYLVANRGLL